MIIPCPTCREMVPSADAGMTVDSTRHHHPDRIPDPPMERYAWEHDVTPIPGEPVTAWGTPVRCIDTDEYCPSCERDNREGHYDNCQLRTRS